MLMSVAASVVASHELFFAAIIAMLSEKQEKPLLFWEHRHNYNKFGL